MPVAKTAKPKLSGFQRRKLARQKRAAEAPERPRVQVYTTGDRMANRLMTVVEWRREIAKVYREMRSGKIRTEEGTRFVYVSEIGARLAKMQEELESIEALRKQLEAMQNGTLQPAQEFLPATIDTHGDDE